MLNNIKLSDVFIPSIGWFGDRHIIKDQMIQGEEYGVYGFNRCFYKNPDNSFTTHIWNDKDSITVLSDQDQDLQEVVDFQNDQLKAFFDPKLKELF